MRYQIVDALYGVHMNTVTPRLVSELLAEHGYDLRDLKPGEMIPIFNNSWEWGGLCDSRTPPRFKVVVNEDGLIYLKQPVHEVLDQISGPLKFSIYIHAHITCPAKIREQLANSLAKQRLALQNKRRKA